MAATPDGRGYWLAASGGRVLHYGQAPFYGSAIAQLHGDHIVAMAATPDGRGYWLAAAGRPCLLLRRRPPLRSAAGELHNDHIVAMAATPDGRGYWLVSSGGRVFRYGDAEYYGSASPAVRTEPDRRRGARLLTARAIGFFRRSRLLWDSPLRATGSSPATSPQSETR